MMEKGQVGAKQCHLIQSLAPQLLQLDAVFLDPKWAKEPRDRIFESLKLSKLVFWGCSLFEVLSINRNLDRLEQIHIVVLDSKQLESGIQKLVSFCRQLRRVEFRFEGRCVWTLDNVDLFNCVKKLIDTIPSIDQIRVNASSVVVQSLLAEIPPLLEPSDDPDLGTMSSQLLLAHVNVLSKIIVNGLTVWELAVLSLPASKSLVDVESLVAGFNSYHASSAYKFAALTRLCSVIVGPEVSETAQTSEITQWVLSTTESLLCDEERFGLASDEVVLALISAYGLSLTHAAGQGAAIRQRCRELLPALKSRDILSLLQPINARIHNLSCKVAVHAAMDLGIDNFAPLTPEMHESDLVLKILIEMLFHPNYRSLDARIINWTLANYFESFFPPEATAAGDDKETMAFILKRCVDVGYIISRSHLTLRESVAMKLAHRQENAALLASRIDDPDVVLDIFRILDPFGSFKYGLEWCVQFLEAATSKFSLERVETVRRDLARIAWRRLLKELRYQASLELPATVVDPSVAVAMKLTPSADLLPPEVQTFLSQETPSAADDDYIVYTWLHQQLQMLQIKIR
jgi:hypothetical protein